MPRYSTEPTDKAAYTRRNDRLYSWFARPYDALVRLLPAWRRVLSHALPHIRDMDRLFAAFDLRVTHETIGWWGPFHLWIAGRRPDTRA
jgi:hypothetical protein